MNTMRTVHDTYRDEVDGALLSIVTRENEHKRTPDMSIRYLGAVFYVMACTDNFGLSSYEIGSKLEWTIGDVTSPPYPLSTPWDMNIIRDTQHILMSLRDPYCEDVYMPPRHTHIAKRLKSTIEYLLRTYDLSDSTIKILKKKKDRCKQILAEEPGLTDEEITADIERYSTR